MLSCCFEQRCCQASLVGKPYRKEESSKPWEFSGSEMCLEAVLYTCRLERGFVVRPWLDARPDPPDLPANEAA